MNKLNDANAMREDASLPPGSLPSAAEIALRNERMAERAAAAEELKPHDAVLDELKLRNRAWKATVGEEKAKFDAEFAENRELRKPIVERIKKLDRYLEW